MSGRSATRKLATRDKKPTRVRVPIIFDQQMADEYVQAGVDLQIAIGTGDDAAREVAKQVVEKARQRLQDVTLEYYFESIGRDAFNDIIDRHPPTPEEEAEAEKDGRPKPMFSERAFWTEALVATCVEPTLTTEEVEEMWESSSWNDDEVTALCQGAWSANKARTLIDVGKGSPRTPNSNGNSSTATTKASRTQRSSASDSDS